MFDGVPEKVMSAEISATTLVSFQIFPSGDKTGVTDVLTIQATLDAATDNAEDQTIIVLETGEFYLDHNLIVGPGYQGTKY